MDGGIYIVTLNNDELISTQAHDRRYDNKNPLKVNKKTENLEKLKILVAESDKATIEPLVRKTSILYL